MNIENNISIKVNNLSFSAGNKNILNSVSLDIEKGKFYSIIGPNGSGKTTLLKHIIKNLSCENNKIFINGKDINTYKPKELARNISYVSQENPVDFDFSVWDIVSMGRYSYLRRFQKESSKDIEIIERSLKQTNTYDLKDKNIRVLSGGERQRVFIARALAQESSILLLDEPISMLDIENSMEILETVKNLNKENNITIVIVLHDLNMACEYSDEIFLMNQGNIVSNGTPKSVLTNKNIEKVYNVAAFLTTNPHSGKLHIIPVPPSCREKSKIIRINKNKKSQVQISSLANSSKHL